MHAHGALKQFVSYYFSCLKLLQCRFLGGAKGIVVSGRFTLTLYQYVPYLNQPCSISLLLLLRRGANDNTVTFYLAVPV